MRKYIETFYYFAKAIFASLASRFNYGCIEQNNKQSEQWEKHTNDAIANKNNNNNTELMQKPFQMSRVSSQNPSCLLICASNMNCFRKSIWRCQERITIWKKNCSSNNNNSSSHQMDWIKNLKHFYPFATYALHCNAIILKSSVSSLASSESSSILLMRSTLFGCCLWASSFHFD